MHGVVGAALFAVIDDVEAAFDLFANDLRDGLSHRGLQFGAARAGFVSSASSSSTTFGVRGRLPVWVVRMRFDSSLEPAHYFGDVLDVRRRGEAMADQLAPLLEIGDSRKSLVWFSSVSHCTNSR